MTILESVKAAFAELVALENSYKTLFKECVVVIVILVILSKFSRTFLSFTLVQ
jgi:hypothetical protein